jgi:hypothetical protein
MADWWGHSRSNYFEVKDREQFQVWIDGIDELEILAEEDGRVAIYGDSYGGWPTTLDDEGTEFDLPLELSAHLADGEIAVLLEGGAEKLRYITGAAVAVNSSGDRIVLSLSDIYERAEAAFGQRPSDATY